MTRRLFTAFTLAWFAGCAAETEFTPYQGAQQNWPTAPGAFVDSKYSVPVYYGPPPRPYKILGYLSTGNTESKGENLAAATLKARKLGGDAVIMIHAGSNTAGTYSVGTATATGGPGYSTTSGYGISVPIQEVTSAVAVIKFLRE